MKPESHCVQSVTLNSAHNCYPTRIWDRFVPLCISLQSIISPPQCNRALVWQLNAFLSPPGTAADIYNGCQSSSVTLLLNIEQIGADMQKLKPRLSDQYSPAWWGCCWSLCLLPDRSKHLWEGSNHASTTGGSACYHGDGLIFHRAFDARCK